MKKILLLLLVSVLSFSLQGCKKDDDSLSGNRIYSVSAHNKNNRGTYRFQFMQGSKVLKEIVIASGEIITFEVPKGDYFWQALQISGYLITPTRYSNSITVNDNVTITF